MKNVYTLKIAFFLALILVGNGLFGQTKRPKIGLVLAGGGAKGLAHIGVLKVLEEAGFDVEIVGGTSMGSIIGGMYAMGYTSETMYKELAGIDWDVMMTNAPDPFTQPIQIWEANQRYQLTLPVINGIPGLPSGFNNGQKIYLKLTYLSEMFADVDDFSNLPREYFCIACDYFTGEEVLFDHGYLPDAMRASMSIPSFFAPVKLDNRILIDGGWINNFPVERMKERGADFIIGVDFPRQAYDVDADLSLFDVMMESNSYVNVRYNNLNRELCDVLIIPELGSISSTDYGMAHTIVKIGEATARKQFARLKFLADSLGIVQREFPNPLPVAPKNIIELHVECLSHSDERIVENAVNTHYTGTVTPETYLATINNLYGTGDFEKVAYRINYDSTRQGYVFNANMKAMRNPGSLNASINYNTDFGVQLLANYTHRNLFFPGYRLTADLIVSESPVVSVAYNSSFGPRMLPAGSVSFFSYSQPLYVDGKVFSKYVFQNLIVNAGMHSNLNVNTVLGIDLVYNHARFSGDAFEFVDVNKVESNYLNLQFHYKHNTLRDAYFATEGFHFSFKTTLSSSLTDNDFTNPYLFYSLDFKQAISLSKKFGMNYRITSGSTLNRKPSGPNEYYLGGYGSYYPLNILPFFGYNRMELFTDGINALSTEVQYNFYGKHYLKAIANAGYAMQLTNPEGMKFDTDFIAGYGGGYAYNSPIGPMQFFVARNADNPSWKLYMYLGFWF